MAEANKQAGGEEPSMEEILQSIKKIISEDDPAGKPAAKANGTGHEEVPGSDVLELTDMISEEAPMAAAKEETPAAPAPASNDVLSKIDEALAVAKPAAAPSSIDSMLMSDQAALAAASSFKKLQIATESPIPSVQTTPSPVFGSGRSVEDMCMEMLKPMMKDWLDKNLPAIVERIVTVEIRKITK